MQTITSKQLKIHFNKVVDCIHSCKTREQMMSCKNMVRTFKQQRCIEAQAQHREMCATLMGFFFGRYHSINKPVCGFYVENILKFQI
jgi:hypothetical protein